MEKKLVAIGKVALISLVTLAIYQRVKRHVPALQSLVEG